jgi:flagellar export protein FliJ
MKKFKFTLQSVHNVREIKQEREELALAQLQTEANRASAQVEAAENARINAYKDYAQRLRTGEIDPVEMALTVKYLNALSTHEQTTRQVLEEKKQACANQSEKVAAAAREVKTTAILRQSQYARHMLELARTEQTALDEMVTTTFARQMSQAK